MVFLVAAGLLLVCLLVDVRLIALALIGFFIYLYASIANAQPSQQHHVATSSVGGLVVMLVSDVKECHGLTQAFLIQPYGPIIDKTCNITLDKAKDELTLRFPSYGEGRPLPMYYSTFKEQY
jgi:hypothetical protein